MSLGREWLIRILTGLVMIPLALLFTGAIAAMLPEGSHSFALVVGGLFYVVGSMVISMAIVHRKAK